MASIDRIAALLRQAEDKGATEHERNSFMEAAQRIATLASIDLEVARAHQANKETRVTPTHKIITVAEKGKRGIGDFADLALAIAEANDLECGIAHDSTYIKAYGFASDIEVLEILFTSLAFQMQEASNAFIKSGEYKKEKVDYWDWKSGSVKSKPVDGRVARKNFMQAYVTTISNRLAMARFNALEDAKANSAKNEDTDIESSSVALVLVGKRDEVATYFKATANHRGTWKGSGRSSGYSSSSRAAGKSAGQRANLGTSRAIGGSRVAIG